MYGYLVLIARFETVVFATREWRY